MFIEMGSKTILYDWFGFIRNRANKDVLYQIAEQLSLGLNYGQFHYSFNNKTDEIGWWIVYEI